MSIRRIVGTDIELDPCNEERLLVRVRFDDDEPGVVWAHPVWADDAMELFWTIGELLEAVGVRGLSACVGHDVEVSSTPDTSLHHIGSFCFWDVADEE